MLTFLGKYLADSVFTFNTISSAIEDSEICVSRKIKKKYSTKFHTN